MKLKKFEEFISESKTQPTAGAKAGKLIDYMYDEDIDYMYYYDYQGLEMPLRVVEDFLKKVGIPHKEAVMVLDVPKSEDFKKTIKMAKWIGVDYDVIPKAFGNESAIIFSEKQ